MSYKYGTGNKMWTKFLKMTVLDKLLVRFNMFLKYDILRSVKIHVQIQ